MAQYPGWSSFISHRCTATGLAVSTMLRRDHTRPTEDGTTIRRWRFRETMVVGSAFPRHAPERWGWLKGDVGAYAVGSRGAAPTRVRRPSRLLARDRRDDRGRHDDHAVRADLRARASGPRLCAYCEVEVTTAQHARLRVGHHDRPLHATASRATRRGALAPVSRLAEVELQAQASCDRIVTAAATATATATGNHNLGEEP